MLVADPRFVHARRFDRLVSTTYCGKAPPILLDGTRPALHPATCPECDAAMDAHMRQILDRHGDAMPSRMEEP
jgi:hypothetical protein